MGYKKDSGFMWYEVIKCYETFMQNYMVQPILPAHLTTRPAGYDKTTIRIHQYERSRLYVHCVVKSYQDSFTQQHFIPEEE